MKPTMWTREQVEAHGLLYTNITLPDATHSALRRTCIELDVTYESVHAFRIAEGKWEVYYKETVTHGFKDSAILP